MERINLKNAELRKAHRMTQQELGDILSVSFQTISKWENNVTMPDITFLPLLPEGSAYTGMDFSGELLEKGRKLFEKEGRCGIFIEADVLKQPVKKQYDLVICNAVLRHLDTPQAFLEKMIQYTKKGGLVVCMDVNREFECSGFYADGMDYAKLCSHPGFSDMWKKELEEQGRDYAVTMKLPHMMKKLGLKGVEARMNDRISFVAADNEEKPCADAFGCRSEAAVREREACEERKRDFLEAQGWDRALSEEETESIASAMVSRGMDLKDALFYCRKQNEIAAFAQKMGEAFAYTHARGVMIVYGRKA